MVMCFSVLTAAVVLAAILRSQKGRKTAGLITAQMILLFIVSIFEIGMAEFLYRENAKVFRTVEIIASVLQFAALVYALLKSNENAEKNGAPVSDSGAPGADKNTARTVPGSESGGGNFSRAASDITEADMQRLFNLKYAPYLVEGFQPVPREYDDILLLDPEHPELRNMALAVDAHRAENPYAGASIAAREIFLNLTNWLKNDKGVRIESLLAVLGAIGGRECQRGIITALKALTDERGSAPSGLLSIFIVDTESGEKYILGDKIANEFCSFYMTAAKDNTYPFEVLKPLSAKCAGAVGTEEYWITPFGEIVPESPKALADCVDGKFEVTFGTYCRYPHERMMAMALAAQRAVDEAVNFMPKERAMAILAEFGWRTSHYIGTELYFEFQKAKK